MKQKMVTINVYPDTRKALRLIAANTGERQYDILARLIAPELIRVEKTRKSSPKKQATL